MFGIKNHNQFYKKPHLSLATAYALMQKERAVQLKQHLTTTLLGMWFRFKMVDLLLQLSCIIPHPEIILGTGLITSMADFHHFSHPMTFTIALQCLECMVGVGMTLSTGLVRKTTW